MDHLKDDVLAGKKEPLQVRIPVDVKREFKSKAALMGLEPNELFVSVWKHYVNTAISGRENG